jgi:hypothetical protein
MSEIGESSDSFVRLREDLRINDIDLALFKYEIINEETIDDLLNNGGNKRNKSYKTYSLIALILFNIIRYITYTFVSINGKVPKSYLDLCQYAGGITQLYRLANLFCLILILAIIILFNYSHSMQWIEIIGILEGNRVMERMRNSNFEYWDKFINRIKLMRIITKLAVYSSVFLYALMSIVLVIISHDLVQIFKYGIIGILLYISLGFPIIFILFYSFLYYYIVCYYCRMRFRIFNNFLEQKIKNKMFIKYKVIDELFREHNGICNKIIFYNKFWKHYFFAINYILIPIYLLVLQQIIFEETNFPVFITSFSGFIVSVGTHLTINSLAASINKESSKLYKSLHNFYLKLIPSLNTKRKIKVYFRYYLW